MVGPGRQESTCSLGQSAHANALCPSVERIDTMRREFVTRVDNESVRGVETLPDIGDPKTVLLCLHGGPGGDLHGNTGGFDELAEGAANEGHAVVQFSFRGSEPSDGAPETITLARQTADYRAMVDRCRSMFTADLVVVGESAGATVAALSWDVLADAYVLLWPAFDLLNTDLRPFLTEERLAEAAHAGLIDIEGVRLGYEFMREVTQTDFNLSFRIPNVPVFMAHGRADAEVPFEQSLRAVAESEGDVVFLADSDADHGFKDPVARSRMLRHLLQWLETK